MFQVFGLTPRQGEVADLAVRGLSTGEIAAKLCLSALTVQDYLKIIFRKVGVHSRNELGARILATAWPSTSRAPIGVRVS